MDLDGITKRMMCIRMPGSGSPFSMMTRMRRIVSCFDSSVPFSSWFLRSLRLGISAALSWWMRLYAPSRNVDMMAVGR